MMIRKISLAIMLVLVAGCMEGCLQIRHGETEYKRIDMPFSKKEINGLDVQFIKDDKTIVKIKLESSKRDSNAEALKAVVEGAVNATAKSLVPGK